MQLRLRGQVEESDGIDGSDNKNEDEHDNHDATEE